MDSFLGDGTKVKKSFQSQENGLKRTDVWRHKPGAGDMREWFLGWQGKNHVAKPSSQDRGLSSPFN